MLVQLARLLLLAPVAVLAQQDTLPRKQQQHALHPTSPCPSVFSYEGRRPEKNRWFGVILVTTEEPLKGIRLDVNLDRPAQLLGNWEGKVSSKDNMHYTIVNLSKRVVPGPPLSVRIFVKFDETDTIPQIKSLRLNGKQICPTEPDVQVRPVRPINAQLQTSPKNTNYPVVARETTLRSDVEWVTKDPLSNTRRTEPPRDPLPWEPPPARQTTELPLPWDGVPKETSSSERHPEDTWPVRDPSRPKVSSQPTVKTPTISHVNREQSAKCGVVDVQPRPLVTYGQRTTRGQWPWHSAVYQSRGIDLRYICGGSLVSADAVITAAHCVTREALDSAVDPDTLVVYLGKYHLKLWSEGSVQDKQVSAIHIHPLYNSNNFLGDIAILKLSSRVEFSSFVLPVCLWSSRMRDIKSVEGKVGTVVGWGYDETGQVTEELMKAEMPVVTELVCLRSYPQFFSHFATNNTYCAGFRNGTSVCNGDSGGGMVFPVRAEDGSTVWQLRGVVSISVSQENKKICDTRHYVVFTDVAKYLDWVLRYIS